MNKTTYHFTDIRVKDKYDELSKIVLVKFEKAENLGCNAELICDAMALIRYRSEADEHIDMLHELMHVEQFYKEGFCQLAWNTNEGKALERTVFHIRNIVDDTYVFYKLYTEYRVSPPISPVFFTVCDSDLKNKIIGHVRGEMGINQTLIGAWRVRMAELVLQCFDNNLSPSDKAICSEFIQIFSDQTPEITQLLEILRIHVKPQDMMQERKHARALEVLRDYFNISSTVLHLARFFNTGNWSLRRVST